ncbi:glycerol-3-phosphate acyltransferase 3-like isoform X1 [Tigriopus californicus]|uniref:glycerol-3-phosphate acyltransferase 3-like isoform X1 n=1 Tax=Tigriopus californicus TaxID=6832 RepID=UPI0027DA1480|nr:glycerol-3-phosphate acyltransferase 3-like isoform X1 [Tigriopus californicus]
MSLWVTFGALTFQFLFPPFLCILALTLVLASLGKSLGVRRLYVQVLLRVFRFARFVTAEHHQRRDSQFKLGGDDDEVDGEDLRSETKDEWNKQPEILDSQTHAASNTTYSQPQNRDHEDSDGDNDGRLAEQVDSGVECASPMSSKSNPTLSDVEEVGSPSDSPTHGRSEPSIQSMRKALKTFGKESRHNVISRRDNLILSPDRPAVLTEEESTHHQSGLGLSTRLMKGENVSVATLQREFEMDDVLDYLKTGIAAIIEDEVTQRFVAEELKSWNLLTRTSLSFEFVNIKLTVIWVLGFFFRYFVLLPCRSIILVFGIFYLLFMTAAVGSIPSQYLRRRLYDYVAVTCFRILSRSFSAVVTFHNKHYRPKSDGICVANHTTPIDVVILQIDRSYALVGQSHGGFFGLVQRALSRATAHVWFERSHVRDRMVVAKRLKEHVEDPNKLPILIFPEGTCINNTSVMQFKKGSFEVGGTIYPVAIKYDAQFGDAFWKSSQNGMLSYIYMMMTSWAIVCDVWYLPPMTRGEGEDAVHFANRVKAEIARQGGLVDLMWDGNLKRMQVKSEWKAIQQEEFSKRLKVE